MAVLPRPPLTFSNEAFVIVHLLGNPIGTLKSLILKVASCQTRAQFWANQFKNGLDDLPRKGIEHQINETRRKWKALTIIVDSYDEWSYERGQEAQEFLYNRL